MEVSSCFLFQFSPYFQLQAGLDLSGGDVFDLSDEFER